jgi:heptosyltransferase-2
LFDAHPAVHDVLVLDKGKGRMRDLLEVIDASGRAKKRRFDMAVFFQNAFEAAFIAALARIPVRVGYATDSRGFLLTHPIAKADPHSGRHQVEYYLDIVRSLGWTGLSRKPRLFVTPEDLKKAEATLETLGISLGETILGMAPGAAFGPAKRWPAERFAKVADKAVEEWDARVLIFGSNGDRESCNDVASAMEARLFNLCGKTDLGEAVALISRCSMFVTNDSGLMHVASALDVPTVAIFGSTNHVATGPISNKARVVRSQVECHPCLKPECPEDFRCMLRIFPGEVFAELKQLLYNEKANGEKK